ncbi:hypothetical protein MYX82_06110 [Acidobacteria bacterium AH-259-D05]|nr:hypothetical protein [Acidobacteria bacterium AH-259-D05]
MKLLTALLLLTGSLLSPLQEGRGVNLGLKDLLTNREFRDYQRKPRYRDRIDLFRKVFERDASLLERYVKRNQMEESSDLLGKIHALCHHVEKESSGVEKSGDLRSKQVKNLEIRLRKLVETIKDLQAVSAFEYMERFEVTTEALEKLRKILLTQLLGGLKTKASIRPRDGRESMASLISFHPSTAISAVKPATEPWQSNDRFTDEEYSKIQLNQELYGRVKVFLEIAESRLEEIRRRMEKREWEEEEENPLEFYTYWDMVHAYRRAIDGVMVNIDEKAIHRLAAEKDIQKSLKELNERIGIFIPQLEPIKQLAIKLQDRVLFQELTEAEEISVIAQKGSLYGLGAPPK